MQFQLMMDMVRAFHAKLGLSRDQRLTELEPRSDLIEQGRELVRMSGVLERLMVKEKNADKRILRAHLMVEELGELLIKMGECDEVETLDGLADLLYVLIGSAVTMDLPLGVAFAEVHQSNMSKEQQPTDESKDRVRSKGPNYKPPNIAELLKLHREGKLPSRTVGIDAFNKSLTQEAK